MDEYKKNILKDRLHKLESNKAIIRKRLGAIDKPDQENILSTLIGKYYKAKELNEATVCVFKVTDWIPDVSEFEIINDYITIFFLGRRPTYFCILWDRVFHSDKRMDNRRSLQKFYEAI